MVLGPFDVEPSRIAALGTRFTEFTNKLLMSEAQASNLRGFQVGVNFNETAPDGGVDATTTDAQETDWFPSGTTAWQFKRSQFTEAQCIAELAGATRAHQILREGGNYVLIIADILPPRNVEVRRRKLAEKAIEIGLIDSDDPNRIRMYDSNLIANWASSHITLALSPLTGGPGTIGMGLSTWRTLRPNDFFWVEDDNRGVTIENLRSNLLSDEVVFRIEGSPGLGRTRLALEALDDDRFRNLVFYISDPREINEELFAYLAHPERTVILVIDECSRDQHSSFSSRLRSGMKTKLITIGAPGPGGLHSPVLPIRPMSQEVIEKFLQQNFIALGSEAHRLIANNCDGNIDWAIALAEQVRRTPDAQAADLIQRSAIQEFVSMLLPEGRDFLAAAVLAMFERIGWDRELKVEKEMIANFIEFTDQDMDEVALMLVERGQMEIRGRYRSIRPLPLAVYFAAEGWRRLSEQVIDELLPQLNDDLALALFRRLVDLGQIEPVRSVLPRLLSKSGPFGTLASIDANGGGRLFTQLSIVLPEDASLHISEMLEESSDEDLRSYSSSRRDFVWTLEKLAWHSRTFERAADALLRLALVEIESYANNSTGVWINLFGTMLPATAAGTRQRLNYLQEKAMSHKPEIREMVIKAASGALSRHESVAVSAELQGGVLVEPRGTPSTRDEYSVYQKGMIDLFLQLRFDDDTEIAKNAKRALIECLHPLLDDQFVGEYLVNALLLLDRDSQIELRSTCEHLIGLHTRHGSNDKKNLLEKLQSLLNRLPEMTPLETLRSVVNMNRWDLPELDLRDRALSALNALESEDDIAGAFEILDNPISNGWEFGYALALDERVANLAEIRIARSFGSNPTALVGFLRAQVELGNPDAFEAFLIRYGNMFTLREQIILASHGPENPKTSDRINHALNELSLTDGISAVFGWTPKMNSKDFIDRLIDWTSRINTEEEYAAVVGWVSLNFRVGDLSETFKAAVWQLLLKRSVFPKLSRSRWDWDRLAFVFIEERPDELAGLIIDLIVSGEIMVLDTDGESELLRKCAEKDPRAVWERVSVEVESRQGWRVQMQLRGWFLNIVPIEIISNWIGDNLERARAVASMASVGHPRPNPIGTILLSKFGDDEEVKENLKAEFVSGSWVGPESARITLQMEMLNSWRQDLELPAGVRNWAIELNERLAERKLAVVQWEAERGF